MPQSYIPYLRIKIICRFHGVFQQTPHHHLKGCGCQECNNVKKLSTNSFIQKARLIHGDEYDYSLVKVLNNRIKVDIICKAHGKFSVSPNQHLNRKSGCPICKSSKGELEIKNFLNNNGIDYIQQKRFKECRDKCPLPFDFYLPDFNTCIEYDGRQHYEIIPHWGGIKGYEKTKLRDEIKNKFCTNNNIDLLRISYKDDVIDRLDNFFV